MKTVSADFVLAQNLKTTYPIARVYYKRRYWNGSNSYVWEASWTELDRSKFSNLSSIVHQLDTETLTEFRVSNLTLTLLNDSNQWDENNMSGYFGSDLGSSYGYEPYMMKFQIRTGFVNAGEHDVRYGAVVRGTEEVIKVFTGVAVEWQFDSESRNCFVTIEGLERLLQDADAKGVSNTVTLETIGTGDDTVKEFYTSYSGIGEILEVTVNSITMTKGTDYNISQLDDIDFGAIITLAKAPAVGQLIKCSYIHWKKNQLLEDLIDSLVSQAGITAKSISSATLGTIKNNITMTSKADFDAGTNTANISTGTENGKMIINPMISDSGTLWNNFSSGTLSDNGWTIRDNEAPYTPPSYAVNSGKVRFTYSNGIVSNVIYRTFGRSIVYGKWEIKISITGGYDEIRWHFLTNSNSPSDGYYIWWGYSTENGQGIKLVKASNNEVIASDDGLLMGSSEKTIKVLRYPTGLFEVYVDSVLILDVIDLSTISGDRMVIYSSIGNIVPEVRITFDDIYIPSSGYSETHQSQTIDTKSGLVSYGNLTTGYTVAPLDVLTVQTRTSNDGSSWDSWVTISGTNAILSNTKRYFQVRYVIVPVTSSLSSGNEETTNITFYTIQFNSTNVFIAMGNFSGKNCYQCIQELAKLTDFEWGMDDDETFFFRQRNSSTAVDLSLTQATNLAQVGYCRVDYGILYSGIRANFGQFVSEQFSAVDVETSAREILANLKIFSIGSDILINKDTNVADGIAVKYLARLEKKRRRLRVIAKFLPQVELSDTVAVTYKHAPDDAVPFLDALKCNVISTRHDCANYQSEFELEEIV